MLKLKLEKHSDQWDEVMLVIKENGLYVAFKRLPEDSNTYCLKRNSDEYHIGYIMTSHGYSKPSSFSQMPKIGYSPIIIEYGPVGNCIWVDPRKIKSIDDHFSEAELKELK